VLRCLSLLSTFLEVPGCPFILVTGALSPPLLTQLHFKTKIGMKLTHIK
jgi:hypothetical protein